MTLDKEHIDQITAALGRDCLAFLPELILCGAIVLLLVMRLFRWFDREHMGGKALGLTLVALAVSWGQWHGEFLGLKTPDEFLESYRPMGMFSGLLMYDNFTVFLRLFLYGFTALVIWLSILTGIPDREDSADFYCLLLGSAVGMSLMASANHLLMVYIGVEMASLPSYALAGFLKGRRQSSEASLKYVVYGGGASGIMLYGISLIAGRFGSASLPDLATGYASALQGTLVAPENLVLLLGTLFVFMGVGFKLAAVPFHFWCPDVFEGAAAEVAAFLSVASKGAALALLGRFALVVAGLSQHQPDYEAWLKIAQFLVPALAFFAALTATFGNLAAYAQTNLKRLLAYSTIAHAGYMMMGLATLTVEGASAVLFYLIVYLFMNLGAFAVVAFLRNQTGSEDLSAYRGLIRRSPWMVLTLAIFLLSLLGLPPLAGFAAKLQIFSALFKAGQENPRLSVVMYTLLVVGGLNTVISLVYYIKVLKVMILEMPIDEVEGRPAEPLPEPIGAVVFAAALAAVLLVVGIWWDRLSLASGHGTRSFHPPVKQAVAMEMSRD